MAQPLEVECNFWLCMDSLSSLPDSLKAVSEELLRKLKSARLILKLDGSKKTTFSRRTLQMDNQSMQLWISGPCFGTCTKSWSLASRVHFTLMVTSSGVCFKSINTQNGLLLILLTTSTGCTNLVLRVSNSFCLTTLPSKKRLLSSLGTILDILFIYF